MLRAFYFFSTRTSYRAKCATFVCNCLTYRLTYISYFIFWPNESNIIRIKWNLVLLWIRILPVYVIRKTMEWKTHGTMVYNFNRNSLRDSRSIEKKKKKKKSSFITDRSEPARPDCTHVYFRNPCRQTSNPAGRELNRDKVSRQCTRWLATMTANRDRTAKETHHAHHTRPQ